MRGGINYSINSAFPRFRLFTVREGALQRSSLHVSATCQGCSKTTQTDGQPPGGCAPSSRVVASFVPLFIISFHGSSWPTQLITHRFRICPLC